MNHPVDWQRLRFRPGYPGGECVPGCEIDNPHHPGECERRTPWYSMEDRAQAIVWWRRHRREYDSEYERDRRH